MNNGHASGTQTADDGEDPDLIMKSDRRFSKLDTFTPSARAPHLD